MVCDAVREISSGTSGKVTDKLAARRAAGIEIVTAVSAVTLVVVTSKLIPLFPAGIVRLAGTLTAAVLLLPG